MRGALAITLLCATAGCSNDESTVAGPGGTSAGGTAGSSGAAGSGATAGAAGASCTPDAPIAAQHAAPLVDLPIAPVAAVKHELSIGYSRALGGFAVVHVTAVPESSGLQPEVVAVRPVQGSLTAGAPIRVRDASAAGNGNGGFPSIAVTPDGSELLIVWSDDRTGSLEIMAQFFSAGADGLAKRGDNFVVSTQPATNDWRPHAVYAAGADRFFVSWADDRSFAIVPGGRYLFARSVGLDGTLGAEVELADGATWQDGVHAASATGRVLFVWSEADESAQPFVTRHRARFIDAISSQPISDLITLFERPSVTPAAPAIAWDALRCRHLVAWQESDNRQIWATLLGADGGTLRAPFQVTAEPAGAGSPHLVHSAASATFLLSYGTWESAEAYVMELDADGDPLSAAESMHASPPAKGSYFQDIAAGDGQALAISNEDYARIEGALFTITSGE